MATKRDYSGRRMSRKMNKVLLTVNIVLFFVAATVLAGNLYYEETVGTVAMLLVMMAACYNAFNSWRNLKEKKQE